MDGHHFGFIIEFKRKSFKGGKLFLIHPSIQDQRYPRPTREQVSTCDPRAFKVWFSWLHRKELMSLGFASKHCKYSILR